MVGEHRRFIGTAGCGFPTGGVNLPTDASVLQTDTINPGSESAGAAL